MDGISVMTVGVALGAMALLALLVGWWMFSSVVSAMWRTAFTLLVLLVVGGGTAAYLAWTTYVAPAGN